MADEQTLLAIADDLTALRKLFAPPDNAKRFAELRDRQAEQRMGRKT